MAQLQGTNIERRFVPLAPCPDGAPHFHIPKGVVERYADWTYMDTFIDPQDNSAWMLAARVREGEN